MNPKKQTGMLVRDLALLGFLSVIFLAVLTSTISGAPFRGESMIMLLAVFLAAVLGFFTRGNISLMTAGATVIGYAAYKLYSFYAYGVPIALIHYAWLFLPLLGAGAVSAFNYGSRSVERENEMLRSQVENLVILDALTGQYNLRALYLELPKAMKQAERLNVPLTLMLIKIRYERELYAMLPHHHYQELLQRFSQYVVDSVRIMDRVYVIDDRGSMAVLLNCDAEKAEMVKDRIRASVLKPEAFSEVLDKNLRVETVIAYLQYDNAITNPQAFKQRVESELVYDV